MKTIVVIIMVAFDRLGIDGAKTGAPAASVKGYDQFIFYGKKNILQYKLVVEGREFMPIGT